jgi:hypothetical protein
MIYNMKYWTIIFIFLSIHSIGQVKTRQVVWLGPADSVIVNGLNIAPLMFKIPNGSTINGIDIEGVGIPIFLYMIPQDPNDNIDTVKIGKQFNINGITLSVAGLIIPGSVKGIAATPWLSFIHEVSGVNINVASITYRQRGIGISLFFNSTVEMSGIQLSLNNKAKRANGLQVGLVNRTQNLRGIQIGLWNINEKRKLPMFNWE